MKLTLYVPDSLYERLEQYRDRINASAVLQRGLETELSALEAGATLGGPEMERAIERLRSERRTLEQEVRDRGRGEGMTWALRSRYVDLASIAGVAERAEAMIRSKPEVAYKLVRKAPRHLFADVRHPNKSDALAERVVFWSGFLEGLMDVWKRLAPTESAEGPEPGDAEEPQGSGPSIL